MLPVRSSYATRAYICARHVFDVHVSAQAKLRLLYRSSEHGLTPNAFWQRCEGKVNTLTVAKVSHAAACTCCVLYTLYMLASWLIVLRCLAGERDW